MNLLEACKTLSVWHIAKARANVWLINESDNIDSLNKLKSLINSKFKEIAREKHPDIGGDSEIYTNLQAAHNLIKESSTSDFISALREDIENSKQFHKPGSDECKECYKWNSFLSICSTTKCGGFDRISRASVPGKFVIKHLDREL